MARELIIWLPSLETDNMASIRCIRLFRLSRCAAFGFLNGVFAIFEGLMDRVFLLPLSYDVNEFPFVNGSRISIALLIGIFITGKFLYSLLFSQM